MTRRTSIGSVRAAEGPALEERLSQAPQNSMESGVFDPPSLPPEEATKLRQELDRLNEELHALRSTDYAVRAYVETWVFIVTALVVVKLVYDWQHTHGKPPVIAIPVAGLSLFVFADSVLQRFKKRFIEADEERRLARQRELRRKLRIDELVLPSAAAGKTG